MDHLGPGRAAGEVAAGRNLDAAADRRTSRRGRDPDVVGTAAGDQTQGAAVHRNQDGKDDGTRGISFPWDHNIP